MATGAVKRNRGPLGVDERFACAANTRPQPVFIPTVEDVVAPPSA